MENGKLENAKGLEDLKDLRDDMDDLPRTNINFYGI